MTFNPNRTQKIYARILWQLRILYILELSIAAEKVSRYYRDIFDGITIVSRYLDIDKFKLLTYINGPIYNTIIL